MIFELVKDYADVLNAMPEDHPKRRMLELLDEALRRDIHFTDRHLTTLFQNMWNLCWWYDCPETPAHYAGRRRDIGKQHSRQAAVGARTYHKESSATEDLTC